MPPLPPPPDSLTEEQILAWLFRLSPLHGAMLGAELSSAERVRCGTQVLSIGPGLVATVAEALRSRPELFPDAPASSDALTAAQRTADAWRALRDRLQAMARLAADAHLAAQTHLQGLVVPFVRDSLAQVPPRGLSPAAVPRRNLVLAPAFFILHAYYKTKARVRANRRAASLRAASASQTRPDLAALAPPPAPSAPGRRSRRPSRSTSSPKEARRVLDRTLTAFLRARGAPDPGSR